MQIQFKQTSPLTDSYSNVFIMRAQLVFPSPCALFQGSLKSTCQSWKRSFISCLQSHIYTYLYNLYPQSEVETLEVALVTVGRNTTQAAADANTDLVAALGVHLDDLAPVVLDGG